VRKKLNKKLALRIETLRYLDYVHGGSGNTCADTCTEPPPEPSAGCDTTIPSAFGCNTGYPICIH